MPLTKNVHYRHCRHGGNAAEQTCAYAANIHGNTDAGGQRGEMHGKQSACPRKHTKQQRFEKAAFDHRHHNGGNGSERKKAYHQ